MIKYKSINQIQDQQIDSKQTSKMSILNQIEKESDKKQQIFLLTKSEKLKIIQSLVLEINSVQASNNLQISINYQPIKRERNPSSFETLYQYNISGSNFRNKSRNSNLISKIQEFEKEQIKNQGIQRKEREKAKLKEKGKEELSLEESSHEQFLEQSLANLKHQDNFRYYKENILCFKCNKVGHYRSVCPQEAVCIYCLSNSHDGDNCPQKKVCYRCYGFGHVALSCNKKQQSKRCHDCEKNHQNGCNFLVSKIKDSGKKRDYYQEIYRDKSIRCTKCFKLGHIQCDKN